MEYELYHHGIKGMKWGIRRTPAQLGHYIKKRKTAKKRKAALEKARQTKAANAKAAAERQKKLEAGRLSPKKMTDKELQDKINRLELEKKYKDALKDASMSRSRGRRFAEKFMDSAVDKLAENGTADIVAQAFKHFAAQGVNKLIGTEAVYANNKKK